MAKFLFKNDENDFFKKQIEENVDEVNIWRFVNVFIPCFIIVIPTLIQSFLPSDRINLQNLILNGSFSLLGINTLFNTSILLIHSIRMKDGRIEKQIIQIRVKLLIYLCTLLFLGTIIYILQIAFSISTTSRILTVMIGFILILWLSIGIGLRIYLIKDELVGRSFNEEIIETVKDLKSSTNDLD